MRRAATVLLLLGAAAALAACNDSGAEAPPVVRPVLSVVAKETSETMRGFAGTVQPRFTTDLGFRVLGRLVARDVDVGDVVAAGQRLAAVDPMSYALQVRSLEADLFKAQAQLGNAIADEDRQQALVEKRAGTQSGLDSAQQARESAEATLTRAQSSLAKAREQLGYTEIKSDSAGVVTAVSGEVGQVVTAGTTVVTVARSDVKEAVVDISDDVAVLISEGSRFVVSLQIDPTALAEGTVREIAPQADAATRSRRVKITLASPPAAFRLGTTITAVPILPTTQGATMELPSTALLERDGKRLVWVIDEAKATVSAVPVEIASTDDNKVRISSGIRPGARVVTAGVNSLTENQKVKIQQEIIP